MINRVPVFHLQVTAGFEPAIRELQSHALPLGYVTTSQRTALLSDLDKLDPPNASSLLLSEKSKIFPFFPCDTYRTLDESGARI